MLRKGFTLIELLVVIAIIAILAAIIFPVFSRVKDSAYRSSDMSNMNALRTALQLYRQDQGGYPPQLLGYVSTYSGAITPTSGDIIPANTLVFALFPKRVDSMDTFRPAYVRPPAGGQYTQVSSATWPNKVDGSSAVNPGSYQKYGPNDITAAGTHEVARCFNPGGGIAPMTVVNYYYTISGYDIATLPQGSGVNVPEIHYAPFWSAYTVPNDPCNPTSSEQGNANDDPRQLGYFDPPATTVVTWDSYFRQYAGGAVEETKSDIVLFLEGNAKMTDSVQVSSLSWKVGP
jgi:prepilin-type N-terminal cleavage/methylation domain-containing protein